MRDPRALALRLGRLLPRWARERMYEPAIDDAFVERQGAGAGVSLHLPPAIVLAIWMECWRLAAIEWWRRARGRRSLAHLEAIVPRPSAGGSGSSGGAPTDPRFERAGLMDTVGHDLRFAWRSARARPGFSLLIVAVLAIGIGGTSVVFTMLNSVVLRPLPYHRSEQLVHVATWVEIDSGPTEASVTPADFLDWRREVTELQAMAAYHNLGFNITDGELPERVEGLAVSSNLFEVLGVPVHAGRSFRGDPGAFGRGEVMISFGLWQQRYAADPEIEGREIRIDDQARRIVGVLPAGFRFAADADLFVAADRDVPAPPIDIEGDYHDNRDLGYFKVVARVRDGATVEQAGEQLEAVQMRLQEMYAENADIRHSLVKPLHEALVGDVRRPMFALLGAVALVLLIACANIAGLLLARATTRQQEIAVRAALGASRARLVRQLLAESVLLALAGGAAGIGLALAVIAVVPSLLPAAVPRVAEIAIDARVLGFAAAVSVLTGLVFGCLPALHLARRDLRGVLQGARGDLAVGLRSARGLLVVSEVALALVLVTGAGLMGKGLLGLLAIDPGLRPEGVLAVRLVLPEERYDEEATRQFYDRVLEEMNAIPGVDAAGLALSLPFSGSAARIGVFLEDQPIDEVSSRQRAVFQTVSPLYFKALGVPLRSGRVFDTRDTADAEQVLVVSEEFVRRYIPEDRDPLAVRLTFGDDDTMRIVGVVADIRHDGFGEPVQPHLYAPYSQVPWRFAAIVLHTDGDPAELATAVRRAVLAVDPLQPIVDARPLTYFMDRSVAGLRLGAWVVAGFAALALLMAGLGIFGLVSHAVAQRVPEIGLRIALGAAPAQVLRMITGQGFVLVAAGLALGLGLGLVLTRSVDLQVAGVQSPDPLVVLGAMGVLAVVGTLAAFVPARRATRVDPSVALRGE